MTDANDNPLLATEGLPEFAKIEPQHVVPAIQQRLAEALAKLAAIEHSAGPSWESTIAALEELDRPFEHCWEPVGHLFGVKNSPELREAYEAVLPEVVEFGLRARQSQPIYQALKGLQSGPEWQRLSEVQQRIITDRIRDAELAGIGARSLAGDILLHPDFGYMYYASIFTELELPPDRPLAENPCPAPSCVELFRKVGQTPCMKFCPVQCLAGEIDAAGRQKKMVYDMAACAEMTQQFESVPAMLMDAIRAETEPAREDALFDPDRKLLWYKISAGSGAWFAQCFECMRACPIATRAPLADPILRFEAAAAKKES